MSKTTKIKDVYEAELEEIFSCPFCTFETTDFEESDEHFTEHTTEYQTEQNNVFERYSK